MKFFESNHLYHRLVYKRDWERKRRSLPTPPSSKTPNNEAELNDDPEKSSKRQSASRDTPEKNLQRRLKRIGIKEDVSVILGMCPQTYFIYRRFGKFDDKQMKLIRYVRLSRELSGLFFNFLPSF